MTLWRADEQALAAGVSELVYVNPFLPERIQLERQILQDKFAEPDRVWSARPGQEQDRANILAIRALVEPLAEKVRGRLVAGTRATRDELELYEDLVRYLLYYRTYGRFGDTTQPAPRGPRRGGRRIGFYDEFVSEVAYFLQLPRVTMPVADPPERLLALFFQIRRAFEHIFTGIIGGSLPTARLRAAVWQSLFTHDLRRFRRGLYERMGDMPTLITGPSGTGKEVVARAIACARYIPFDPKTLTFAVEHADVFYPLNLSALSPTLIESELFGHRRGSFTGAVEDREGWLASCPALGTVFLDEIGELDPLLQVKLLRVLQVRQFQRLGDTETREFKGKILAATNRDLAAEMKAGRFREDFFYRLCADMVSTPTLREQLDDSPGELPHLVEHIARQVAGDEAAALTKDVVAWIEKELPEYAWPGNFRELEQCVRNVLIRGEYRPLRARGGTGGRNVRARLAEEFVAAELPAEAILRRYVTLVYAQTRSFEETGKRLGVDRRTVKARVDEGLLRDLGSGGDAKLSSSA